MKDTTKTPYIEAMGRRKTANARVRITPSDKKSTITVNSKELADYFVTEEMQTIVMEALKHPAVVKTFTVTAVMNGGGIHSQAEALRHGIARALVAFDSTLRIPIKQEKLLTRDARMKERRKFGLKKARKAPQWSKR